MLYVIGIGLCDPSDVTLQGFEIVKKCQKVYLESYTSIISCGLEELKGYYGCNIVAADRDHVEQQAEDILEDAKVYDVAFLVVGDPFAATTHTDLVLRASQLSVPVKVVNNASIFNAASCCGLPMTKFGETVSIPFWTDGWQPESFLDKINTNLKKGLHTLCLLDIKVKEQSLENLLRGRKIYEPPQFMRVQQAIKQLLDTIKKQEGRQCELHGGTCCIGIARAGSPRLMLKMGSLEELSETDFGEPLHSLVICGSTSEAEAKLTRKICSYFDGAGCRHLLGKNTVYFVGLGLHPCKDVTLKALDIIKNALKVYIYHGYFIDESLEELGKLFDRELVYLSEAHEGVIESAHSGDVAVLVGGDPFDRGECLSLLSSVIDSNLKARFIHNCSILTACACSGLQLYTFGETVHFYTSGGRNSDYSEEYKKIKCNLESGWHTLCLLGSIKKEGIKMDINAGDAVKILHSLAVEDKTLPPDQRLVLLGRAGTDKERIISTTLENAVNLDVEETLHSLIVVGHTHPIETDFLNLFK